MWGGAQGAPLNPSIFEVMSNPTHAGAFHVWVSLQIQFLVEFDTAGEQHLMLVGVRLQNLVQQRAPLFLSLPGLTIDILVHRTTEERSVPL